MNKFSLREIDRIIEMAWEKETALSFGEKESLEEKLNILF